MLTNSPNFGDSKMPKIDGDSTLPHNHRSKNNDGRILECIFNMMSNAWFYMVVHYGNDCNDVFLVDRVLFLPPRHY